MLQHLAPMSFFDESVIPESLYYVSGFRMLEDEGLKGLVNLLRREIKGQRASLLVLDGLVAAEEAAARTTEPACRRRVNVARWYPAQWFPSSRA